MFLLKRPEPTLTIAQKALLRARQIDARGLFAVVNALLLALVAVAAHRYPQKFVRVTGECATNWVQLGGDERVVCCDVTGTKNTEPPCHYGMDLAPVLASPKGAWVLPMLAVIFNYVALMLFDEPTMPRIRVVTRRGALYVGVMLLRTVVLYMGLNRVEHGLVALLMGSTAETACWYKDRRRSGACAPHFDHSDHIVLFVAHYLSITLFEWFALNVEIAAPAIRSAKKTVLQLWMVLLCVVTTYTLFSTASYFHSTLENMIGLVIAQLGAMLPLYLISQDYFAGNSILRLRNFVLPADAADVTTKSK